MPLGQVLKPSHKVSRVFRDSVSTPPLSVFLSLCMIHTEIHACARADTYLSTHTHISPQSICLMVCANLGSKA